MSGSRKKQPRRRRPRKPGCDLDDAQLLRMVRAGLIDVDPQAGTARICYRNHAGLIVACQPREPRTWHDDRGYLFIRVCWDKRQRGVTVHRLVWMAAHDRVPPEGHEINHRNRVKDDNRIGNLEMRERFEHQRDDRRKYWERRRAAEAAGETADTEDFT